MKNILICSISLFFFANCVEKFDLGLESTDSHLVVEGLVENNAGPHYIRLTKSNVGVKVFEDNDSGFIDNFDVVEDATVILTDDFGQVETLELIPKNDQLDPYDYPYQKFGGFYKTTNFIGVPGRTYFLKVITKEGKIYTASDYMKKTPQIESLSYELRTLEKDGSEYYVPLLHFDEPNSIGDYYLISNSEYKFDEPKLNTISTWRFEVLSDKNLNSGSISTFLDNGAEPNDFGYYPYSYGSEIHVKMSSLSIESYNYYKLLLTQFEQDGGAYNPSPASPPTNISNGGLGFFRASAVAEAETIIEE